jgi:beta-lactamase class C
MSAPFMHRAVQGYAADGKAIGSPGNQQSYYDFPGTGQMFSTAHDLALFVAAALNEGASDAQLRKALQLTQREAFRVDKRNAQAMAWEINNLGGAAIVDKPGGLNNASAYMGLVPERSLGIVILSNRGDMYLHELGRNVILPALAKL